MGIYDREYYRRDGPSLLGSLGEHGKVCKWLILINVAVFILQLVTTQHGAASLVTALFELTPHKVLQGQVWRLLTYSFLHDGFYHILFNMLFLWWFGSDVEDLYGAREFLLVYLTSAVLGGAAFFVGSLLGYPPIDVSCVGASGAVMAIIVLCALHYPRRVIYLFFVLPVPIWAFALFEVAQDAFVLIGGMNTGVAVTVHLAGAAFAYAYFKLHWRLSNLLPALGRSGARRRPRLQVYREDDDAHEEALAVASAPLPREPVDEHLEAKLDAVLEKVARQGRESLTESERQILMRASEIYRKKRT